MSLTPDELTELRALMKVYPLSHAEDLRYKELYEKAMRVSLPAKIALVIIQGIELIFIHVGDFINRRISR